MAERGILFSTPMVRALLAGTKTQTRRVVGLQPPADGWPAYKAGCAIECGPDFADGDYDSVISCPYGMPGDRLWVREAWRVTSKHDDKPPRDLPPRKMTVFFEAGGSIANQDHVGDWREDQWPPRPGPIPEWVGKLRPGMFMPRWASRVTLEVTGVRVERLQDISDADAVAEGIGLTEHAIGVQCTIPAGMSLPRAAYRTVWESINGAGSWAADPWVWCVEFKRVIELRCVMPFFKLGDTVVHVKMAKQPRRYCCAELGPGGAGHCGAVATILCDHPVGPQQRRRCSAPLCADHAVTAGHDTHYCPRHASGPKQEEMF